MKFFQLFQITQLFWNDSPKNQNVLANIKLNRLILLGLAIISFREAFGFWRDGAMLEVKSDFSLQYLYIELIRFGEIECELRFRSPRRKPTLIIDPSNYYLHTDPK